MKINSEGKSKALLSSIKGIAAKLRTSDTIDGLVNSMSGVGTRRDKNAYNTYIDNSPLSVAELETLYANNDLAYTIVSKPVEDALRAWFSVESEDPQTEDEEMAEDICNKLRELDARRLVQEAAIWGRLFGGGGVILGVSGAAAGTPGAPLDDETVEEVEFLEVWDRQDMQAVEWYPNGDPKIYLWSPPPKGAGVMMQPVRIHESRLLTFGGATTTNRRKAMNEGWDLSILQRVYEVLQSFDAMWKNTDAMFADASQAVFKLNGFIEALASQDGEGQQDVQVRLAFMDMMRSTAKAIMMDNGNKDSGENAESFEVVERATLGGLDGVMQTYMVRLATAARMPLTVLLGMAPAGQDATGDSDLLLYYNNIDVYRMNELEAPLLRLVRMVARELGDENPERWNICWPELARPKPLDVATAEKMRIDSAVALVTSQAILPEELALNIKRIAPTLGIRVDMEARRKAVELGLEEVENREVGMAQAEAEAAIATEGQIKVEKAKPKAPNAPKASARKTPAKAKGRQTA